MATDLGKVGMRMRGNWDSSTAYEVLDAVTYNNALYIAKQNVPANTVPTNTTYWQVAINYSDVARVGSYTLNTYKSDDVTSIVGGLTKVGRMVSINARWVGTLSGGNAPILTLPEQYRPASDVDGVGMVYRSDNSTWNVARVTLGSAGILTESSTSASRTSGQFSISYYI